MPQTRKELEIPFKVVTDDVKEAVCADPNQCTFAKAIMPIVQEQYGVTAAATLNVQMASIETLEDEDKVLVAWDGDDGRHYSGELSGNVAKNIVRMTDLSKPDLLKLMRRKYKNGIDFKVENLESRNKQMHHGENDETTLRFARRTGYGHGRTAHPEMRRALYEETAVFQTFTDQQKTEYSEGWQLGIAAGPNAHNVKRKPRRSGKNGRFGVIEDAK